MLQHELIQKAQPTADGKGTSVKFGLIFIYTRSSTDTDHDGSCIRWRRCQGVTQIKSEVIEQGKSEGFESCDRPIVRKRPIWVKIGDVLSCVTLKFDEWPWKTIGHLFNPTSSFVHHFVAIGDSKLELQSGNAQFGSKSTIFRAMWPCNWTYDLEKQ